MFCLVHGAMSYSIYYLTESTGSMGSSNTFVIFFAYFNKCSTGSFDRVVSIVHISGINVFYLVNFHVAMSLSIDFLSELADSMKMSNTSLISFPNSTRLSSNN